MTSELSKIYEPKAVEKEVYEKWSEAKAFHADPAGPGESYCIVIPPPNVTGALHLGHALNNSLQDILIRWRRMQGRNTLWMPGTDHASISTQTIVEKRILAEEGKRRTDFSRENFVARVQKWKDEYEARILGQLKLMGCSCDWDRTRFTMDEVCAKAVRETFFKLFSDGLIYRGKRLVNWDPATQTVLADDEVEHETVQGNFYYLNYPLTEPCVLNDKKIEHITVATTRPETMLGDTAVAMNPKDPRAKFLVGKKVRLPIVGREIPIIFDDHVVLADPESEDEKAKFSTGFLKVTPAHDPNDWEIGRRHDLPVINVMAPDGSISDKHGWTDWDAIKNPDVENLIGMDRFEAREAIVEWFRKEKLLQEIRAYAHEVGHSYRSHVPIEPYLSDQWYVAVKKPIASLPADRKRAGMSDADAARLLETRDGVEYLKGTDVPVNSLAGLALAPLLDGRIKFTPERYANNYRAWLENLRDWPISRQLWWGHQIPVWSQDIELPQDVKHLPTKGHQCDARTVAALDRTISGDFDQEFRKHPVRFILTIQELPDKPDHIRTFICLDHNEPGAIKLIESGGWKRDPDVLDTWFSSALWPFSTLGWPEQTDSLKKYYPGSVLCTAREIITLWVSRMVMMGQYCAGDIPFRDVFIHAMIQDGEGRKMSKSLGNGIDPLDIIDSHGSDAMRYTLAAMTTQTQDVRMPVVEMTLPDGRKMNASPKFDIGRNFANKLWNASRFVLTRLEGVPAWSDINPSEDLADRWILSRLTVTIQSATASLKAFRFNELADTLYHFMWDDFCDWYVEIAKSRMNGGQSAPKAVLAHVLDSALRLLHPIMPYITEAIWEKLNAAAPCRGPAGAKGEELLILAAWPTIEPKEATKSGTGVLGEAKPSGTGVPPVCPMGVSPMDAVSSHTDSESIEKRHGAYLPHWTSQDAIYSVCFRLVDSLPSEIAETWRKEREEVIQRAKQQNRDLTYIERKELQNLFSQRVESFLNAGAGECLLKDARIAELVQNALFHFEGQRYELIAWAIMPNHVHVVLRPLPENDLSDILHSWKSFTAKEINKVLNRKGQFWLEEYYDHLIRDEEDFNRAVIYVRDNPAQAGLKDWPWSGTRITDHGQDAHGTHGRDARATLELPNMLDDVAEQYFEFLQNIISEIRNIRTKHNVPPGKKVDVLFEAEGMAAQILSANVDLLKSQANLSKLEKVTDVAAIPKDAVGIIPSAGRMSETTHGIIENFQERLADVPTGAFSGFAGLKFYVCGIVDRKAELARLTKQKETLEKGVKGLESKLAGEGFAAKAPPQLVEKERQRLETLRNDLASVDKLLAGLDQPGNK
ncbi:MAG: valine--tRNA ligase [Planctomycetes bacterium]|nr:valine--tRNA ligase [Planctomycetota bacterium]